MNSEVMTKAILEIKEDLGEIKGTTKSIKEKVDAHDVLLQNHGDLLTEINKRTYNLDSWKNGIIYNVVEEKEKAVTMLRQEQKDLKDAHDIRIKTLEMEKEKRDKVKEDNQTRAKSIYWGVLEKGIWVIITSAATVLAILKSNLFK
jgi:hypothetical protein